MILTHCCKLRSNSSLHPTMSLILGHLSLAMLPSDVRQVNFGCNYDFEHFLIYRASLWHSIWNSDLPHIIPLLLVYRVSGAISCYMGKKLLGVSLVFAGGSIPLIHWLGSVHFMFRLPPNHVLFSGLGIFPPKGRSTVGPDVSILIGFFQKKNRSQISRTLTRSIILKAHIVFSTSAFNWICKPLP